MSIESIILSVLNLAALIVTSFFLWRTYYLQKRLVKFQEELVKFQGELVKLQGDLVKLQGESVKFQEELVKIQKPNLFIKGITMIEKNESSSDVSYIFTLDIINISPRVITLNQFIGDIAKVFDGPFITKANSKYFQSPDHVHVKNPAVYPVLKEGSLEIFQFLLNKEQYKKLKDLKEIELIDYAGIKYKGKLYHFDEKGKQL